jgi:hypothetical protein
MANSNFDMPIGGAARLCLGRKHEIVKAAFEAEGYELLSTYRNNSQKLDFICPKEHSYAMTWGHFQQGQRCAVCAGRILTHEQVKAAFESDGYTLLNKYGNRNTQLEFICPQGHRHSMTWKSFQQGQRCLVCKRGVVTHEQVRQAFEERGYTLKSQYVNNRTKLEFICDRGHEHAITWISFSRGNQCAWCAGLKKSHEEVQAAFEKAGYTLLSQYESTNKKLNFICPNNHKYSIAWNKFNSGKRCGRCAGRCPTDEEKEIDRIGETVRKQISQAVRLRQLKVRFSKHAFAKKVAKEILKSMGSPPKGYHIDHIVPQSFFDLRNEVEMIACWSVCNLRYLPMIENSKRSNKLSIEDFALFSPALIEVLKIASRKPVFWDEVLSSNTQ